MKIKRITFITPPPMGETLYGDLDFEGLDSITPPLNLLSLAAYIREKGYQVFLIDGYANNFEPETMVSKIMATNPDYVGITASSPMFNSALEIAQKLKHCLGHVKIIIGGPHTTALPFDVLCHDVFDVGIVGEGEISLFEVLDAYENNKSFKNISGIVFRDNQNKIAVTEKRVKIKNLDTLPFPAWDLLPSLNHPYKVSIVSSKKNKSTSIVTSRGCPGRCTFCDTSTFGREYRFFSSEYVLGMIEHLLLRYGINDFVIYDDTFCTNKNRLVEICKGIINRGWEISWQCCARIEQVNEEILLLMKRAGCWEIEYGIESADPDILKSMKKGVNLSKARKIISLTHEFGMKARGNFIFGYLGETKKSLDTTIDYILSTDLDYVQQSFLTPYPGSEVYEIAHKYGAFDKDFRRMSNLTINFIPHGLTKNELQQYSRNLFLRFYLRPRIIWRLLKSIKNKEDIQRLFISFFIFVNQIVFSKKNK